MFHNTLVLLPSLLNKSLYYDLRLEKTFTPFKALQRFTKLTEFFYPQHITWDRISWVPHLTPKKNLVPWFVQSGLVFMAVISLYFLQIRDIFIHDSTVLLTSRLTLIFYLLLCTLVCNIIVTFLYFGVELCFVLKSLQNLEGFTGLGKACLKNNLVVDVARLVVE